MIVIFTNPDLGFIGASQRINRLKSIMLELRRGMVNSLVSDYYFSQVSSDIHFGDKTNRKEKNGGKK